MTGGRGPRPSPRGSLYDETGDSFPGASAASAIGVSTLTGTAKDIIEGAFLPLWVRGEISDFKAHRNGHWYFCLRDAAAQMRCVVWSRDTVRMPASPDDGMQVVAFGRLTVYAARGDMQFAIARMEAEGDGLWRKALEITRRRLEADGLLAPERKRALPRFPRTIAVITSPDGAALRDIVAVVKRRGTAVRLVVVPAAVQGDSAPEELCVALDRVNRWGEADLVIVGRGGGGREDLRAFNNEHVARAVADCRVPTISAVGHEVDISLCDLVADVRAATPSAAAEIATRSAAELRTAIGALDRSLEAAARGAVDRAQRRVRDAGRGLAMAARLQVDRRASRLEAAAGQLHTLSPVNTLARGFAVARGADGATLSSVSQFDPQMPFELVLRDGVVGATSNTAEPRSRVQP